METTELTEEETAILEGFAKFARENGVPMSEVYMNPETGEFFLAPKIQ